MSSWFVRPELTRIVLSEQQWILVKKRLNAGEERATYARMYTAAGVDGKRRVDPLAVGLAVMVAYLVDWSLLDDEGNPITIRGLSSDELARVLDGLMPERFGEIREAVEAHENTMREERERQKKVPSGDPALPPISP
jgi:hypothetical protein